MPRLLALEWNESEARAAVASLHGREAVIEQAFSVSMRPQPGSDQPVDAGQRLAAALAARGIGKLETLVAIGRTNIELRQLTIPPAPEEEMPEMVRFQALREFNAMQDDWTLDYMPIDDAPDQPQTVLAAAMAPEQIGQIREICHKVGLKPKRVVLRPCGAASLFCRQQADGRPRVRLLVDLLDDEADLTVMIDRKVIFLRTARLPGDPLTEADAAAALIAEFRRTMAAVQNQLAGRRVESVVLCGSGPQHTALAEMVDQRLGVPGELFDPFAGLKLAGELERGAPERPGPYAPLLGLLLDELHGEKHAVDFLNPRRRPEAPNQRRTYLLVATVALLVIALPVFYVLLKRAEFSGQIEDLNNAVAQQKTKNTELDKSKKVTDRIREWQSGDAVWLDELKWVSEKLPSNKAILIRKMTLTNAEKKASSIEMEMLGKEGVPQQVVDALEGPNRNVQSKGGIATTTQRDYPDYSLQFEHVVTIGEPAAKPAPRAKGKP